MRGYLQELRLLNSGYINDDHLKPHPQELLVVILLWKGSALSATLYQLLFMAYKPSERWGLMSLSSVSGGMLLSPVVCRSSIGITAAEFISASSCHTQKTVFHNTLLLPLALTFFPLPLP